MTTTIKITELTNIGANLASSTVIPVVNMAGTPTTEKTVLGNIANVILAGAGGNYVSAAKATTATTANTVLTNAQPNITSIGNLTGLTVSNATGIVNFSNTANVTLGNVSNLHIAGGTAGQLLSTNGNGTLSWASDTTTYGNSNVVSLMASFGSNTITTTGNVSVGNIIGNGQALTNIAGANVSGFVPNANVANTAFAVAAANVSGLGNIATLNLDGNVSNLLTGTGTYVAIPVVPTVGNIATINLDGNVSNVLRGDGTFGADANSSYGDSNVVSLLAAFGSNTIVTTGIITADGANLSNVPYANLTGAPSLGNISNINLDGNVSNLLTGNGTYVAIPTVPTVGNIATLNLDGNVSNLLTGNGTYVAIPVVPTVGNIATINLTGSTSNVLFGNGTFAVVPAPTVTPDISSTGDMSIMTYDGVIKSVNYATVEPSSGNIKGGNISANGNISGGNISATGNITGNTNGFAIGYLNIPQIAAANATLALTDAGKHYYSTTAGNLTLTIPTNANVAFATGTAVSIVVQAAGNILVNAASGVTLYMAGNSTAANRVVGDYGMATLMKVGTDTWFINGTGVA